MGNSGTVKTHLATSMAFQACALGQRVRFSTVTGLMIKLREQQQLARFHKQLQSLHQLVLYEFGYVPCSKAGAELLFEVVSPPYERSSLIITTYLPFEAWTEVLGSELLTHRLHILRRTGKATGRLNPGSGSDEAPPKSANPKTQA